MDTLISACCKILRKCMSLKLENGHGIRDKECMYEYLDWMLKTE